MNSYSSQISKAVLLFFPDNQWISLEEQYYCANTVLFHSVTAVSLLQCYEVVFQSITEFFLKNQTTNIG